MGYIREKMELSLLADFQKVVFAVFLLLFSISGRADGYSLLQEERLEDEVETKKSWGDQGDGTYVNPILNADYSDPDVIRVKEKYYMVCSEFHYMGIPVLESEDMVNWKIIGQVYDRMGFPEYDRNERYGGGSWAPSLRYHQGKFWVYFCTPNEGLFMSTATNPSGPWSPLLQVKNVSGWEDPCPFWDEDGQAYLGRSQLGGGPIILHRMSEDGTRLLDEGEKIYEGPTAEGTKLFRKDGYYYLSIPEGGVSTGWQTVLRAKDIYGPYVKKVVLEQGATRINGPHQGAFVDTPEGEWWFYHFQSTDPLGRVVHLQPVMWREGWPFVGKDYDGNGIGEPVGRTQKPKVRRSVSVCAPQTSDEFTAKKKGLQWQINHNPVAENWSLVKRRGWLMLKAMKADCLRNSRNMFTQKTVGVQGEASVLLDSKGLADGQRAGLFCVGSLYCAIGITEQQGSKRIYIEQDGEIDLLDRVKTDKVYFKVTMDAEANRYRFYYSLDNRKFIACGEPFSLSGRDWKGVRVGLFSYNVLAEEGEIYFDWFRYRYDGPGKGEE